MSDHFSASPLSPGFASCFRVFTGGIPPEPCTLREIQPGQQPQQHRVQGGVFTGETDSDTPGSVNAGCRCSGRMFDSRAGQLQMSEGSAETETL
ncbi:hypothetical protein CesoFtcFv8_005515 [Champsocephalus esox]|uniref:Uncharacterized protein n=1 Tax=Champsocephalus esox TaxID=159716 RepID=A0AAN8CSC6_9TELE|nr:hypothetical protein CesoFtcFv8_005515 [Champsocephalus esox]